MKYLLIIIFAVVMSACGDKSGVGIIDKIVSPNVEGRYVGVDKTVFVIKDGEIILEGRGIVKEMRSAYKVVGDKIEFNFEYPVALTIIDSKTLSLMGAMSYTKMD